jgi:diketogulonate reductase-like aldo/keto reductase
MFVTLNNGVKMPQIGFGVFKVDEGESVVKAVKKAIEVGYRSIDTAAIYQNEKGVGQAIRESGVPREELFITTKVWNADQGYHETMEAFQVSMDKLGLDYLDLYLIHWPMPKVEKYVETYQALEKLYKDGHIRSIGVANFQIPHLEKLLKECSVKPVINQVECHPYLTQNELKEFCQEYQIFLEAWGPLMQGGEALSDEIIKTIANKHKKTPAQVILRWHIQNQVIAIPKSVTPSRIEENFRVFDFELTSGEMKLINGLNRDQRNGSNPDTYYKM